MSAILKFDFQKREQLRFFRIKSSKLHIKDPILHVAITFFLKQGETRTSHGPIPHPLIGIPGSEKLTFHCNDAFKMF